MPSSTTVTAPSLTVSPSSLISMSRLAVLTVEASSTWRFTVQAAALHPAKATASDDQLFLDLPEQGFYRVTVYLLDYPQVQQTVDIYRSQTKTLSEVGGHPIVDALWGKLPDIYQPVPLITSLWQGLVHKTADLYSLALADKVDFFTRKYLGISGSSVQVPTSARIRPKRSVTVTPIRTIGIAGTGTARKYAVCVRDRDGIKPLSEWVGRTLYCGAETATVSSVKDKYMFLDAAITEAPLGPLPAAISVTAVVGSDRKTVYLTSADPITATAYFLALVSTTGTYYLWARFRSEGVYVLESPADPGTYALSSAYAPVSAELSASGFTSSVFVEPKLEGILWGDGLTVTAKNYSAYTVCSRPVWDACVWEATAYSWVRLPAEVNPGDIIRWGIRNIANQKATYFDTIVLAYTNGYAALSPTSGDGTFSAAEWGRLAGALGVQGVSTSGDVLTLLSPAADIAQALKVDKSLDYSMRLVLGDFTFDLWLMQIRAGTVLTSTAGYVPTLLGSDNTTYAEGREFVQYARKDIVGCVSGPRFYISPSLVYIFQVGDVLEISGVSYTITDVGSCFVALDDFPVEGTVTATLLRDSTELRFSAAIAGTDFVAPVVVEDNREYLSSVYGTLCGAEYPGWTPLYGTTYHDSLDALFKVLTSGATIANIHLGMDAVLGLPVIARPSMVTGIYDDDDETFVILESATGVRTVELPKAVEGNALSGPADGIEVDQMLEDVPLTNLTTVQDYLSGSGMTGLRRFHTFDVLLGGETLPTESIETLASFIREYPVPVQNKADLKLFVDVYDDVTVEDEVTVECDVFLIDDIGSTVQGGFYINRSLGMGYAITATEARTNIFRLLVPVMMEGTLAYDGADWTLTIAGGFTDGITADGWDIDTGLVGVEGGLSPTQYDYVVIPALKTYGRVTEVTSDTEVVLEEVPVGESVIGWDSLLPTSTTTVNFYLVRREVFEPALLNATIVSIVFDAGTNLSEITFDVGVFSDGISPGDIFVGEEAFRATEIVAVGWLEVGDTPDWTKIWVIGNLEGTEAFAIFRPEFASGTLYQGMAAKYEVA